MGCDSVRVPWGLLPVAVPLAAVLAVAAGALMLPGAGTPERLLAGAVTAVAGIAVTVRVLGAVGLLRGWALLAVLVLATVATVVPAARRGPFWRLPWRSVATLYTTPLLLVAVTVLAISVTSAYLLPVWQWDALGYHLPYVNFALQNGSLSDVPPDAAYLSTYPHVVENVFAAWRALLPDDRLVELAHVPLGVIGWLAIAVIARQLGAAPAHAVAAGAAWLTLPAVFLQLPTNYTDVASAALLLAAAALVLGSDIDARRIVLAGVALGLFLGSKPQAPPATLVMLTLVTVIGIRAGHRAAVAGAWLLTVLLGAESYVVNVVRFGNPVWPVRVDLGPVHLPGRYAMSELLNSGAAARRTHGNVVERVAQSWSTVVSPQNVFDMRIGGLGLLFMAALVVAVVRVIQTRSVVVAVVAVATLATPDPAVARYVLPFAGLVLAVAVVAVESLRAVYRWMVFAVAALVAAFAVYTAYPGLQGEGPPLGEYWAMTAEERRQAVGASGRPTPYLQAWARLGDGERTLFDGGAELPYLAWPFDLSRQAARIPDDVGPDEATAIIADPSVRLLIVGDDSPVADALRADPSTWEPLFACNSAACTVYARR